MFLHTKFKEKGGWLALLVITVLWGANTGVFAWAVSPVGQMVITPFDYNGVSLNGGRLKAQLDLVKGEYLNIDNNNLLWGFRGRAGLPHPGGILGGWYGSDTFHIFGQIVGGLSRMYAATGDVACRDKANYLVSEWAKCIEPNGFFFDSNTPNWPHYEYDMTVNGLLDAYLYCRTPEALPSLSRITDWAIANLAVGQGDKSECEGLYRAYLITGDTKYKNFGAGWEYTTYWNLLAQNQDPFANGGGPYHAYTHVDTLYSDAMAYLVYGQQHYLDTLTNAYDYLTTHQTYATGGYGPDEQLQATYQNLVNSLMTTTSSFEAQCGSWAVFKLVKSLISFTGDARYGDWAELLTYNGVGATVPNSNGVAQYYSNYNLYGGSKTNNGTAWSCDMGTRPEATADYTDLTWFKDTSNLYVNLYTPSTVHWTCSGKSVTVSQSGELEYLNGITFTVSVSSPVIFGMKFRVPGWVVGSPSVKVNGATFSAATDSKHWLVVNRTWSNGDTVAVTLPLGLYAKRLDSNKVTPSAIMYGPMVLTGPVSALQQASTLDMSNISSQLQPAAGTATFSLKSDPSAVLRPFYSFVAGEQYFMYIDPNMDKFAGLTFTGTWFDTGAFQDSNTAGSALAGTFTGTFIKVKGYKFNNAGIAQISIDCGVVGTFDEYGPCRQCEAVEWSYCLPDAGPHAFSLSVTGQKDPNSLGVYINIGSVQVLNLPGDLNCDGHVDLKDLAEFAREWLTNNEIVPTGGITITSPAFSGSWTQATWYSWPYWYSNQAGATVTAVFDNTNPTFFGNGIRLQGLGWSNSGNVDIYLDGALQGRKNFYTASNSTPVNVDINNVPAGTHVVAAKVVGNGYFNFMRYEPLNPGIRKWSGTWYGSSSPLTGDKFLCSNDVSTPPLGSQVWFKFYGTGLIWYATSYQDSAMANIWIDVNSTDPCVATYKNVDQLQYGQPNGSPWTYTITGLAPGWHTIKIRNAWPHINPNSIVLNTGHYWQWVQFTPIP